MITIPEFVKDYIKVQAKEKGSIRVDINVFDKEGGRFLYKHGLTFTRDLNFHGTGGYTLGIEEYLARTLTYARKSITICINGKLLSDIHPILLPPPSTPPEIDLTHTTQE